MNEEGAQLRDESVPHLAMLAGSPTSSFTTAAQRSLRGSLSAIRASGRRELERRIYVFDRDHLDADPELVARELAITNEQLLTEAELQRMSSQLIQTRGRC
jgi:autophagy-related protein 11